MFFPLVRTSSELSHLQGCQVWKPSMCGTLSRQIYFAYTHKLACLFFWKSAMFTQNNKSAVMNMQGLHWDASLNPSTWWKVEKGVGVSHFEGQHQPLSWSLQGLLNVPIISLVLNFNDYIALGQVWWQTWPYCEQNISISSVYHLYYSNTDITIMQWWTIMLNDICIRKNGCSFSIAITINKNDMT